jgi:anthranilate synthase component 2
MKILVIDNYDSFTYNLVYMLRQEALDIKVYRNDKIEPKECLDYDAIILSPGPGIPKDSGNLSAIIETCAGKVPMLGVCLGHQAIAEYLGGELRMLPQVHHGVQSSITSSNTDSLFNEFTESFLVGRYHSWDVNPEIIAEFEVTAVAEDSSIMAIQNRENKLFGIQFHPESILTPNGDVIIKSFLNFCKT